jgi:serine protease inhibitor
MEVNEGSPEVTAASAAVVFQKTAFVDKMDFVADHSFLFPDQRRQVDLR